MRCAVSHLHALSSQCRRIEPTRASTSRHAIWVTVIVHLTLTRLENVICKFPVQQLGAPLLRDRPLHGISNDLAALRVGMINWEEGMAQYLGLDGFRGGWVAAWIDDDGNHGFDYSPSLHRLLLIPHHRAILDIPIGLKLSGHRRCALKAREMADTSV